MFIKEYRHGFRTLYFVTQVKDDKYFNALFRFDSLNRQMCAQKGEKRGMANANRTDFGAKY